MRPGFRKQGKQSVGVARQYCGPLGKVANCQVGVFLAYVSPRGHALVDGELFLPRSGSTTLPLSKAGIPEKTGYQTALEWPWVCCAGHSRRDNCRDSG